jgi:hypothetical protein
MSALVSCGACLDLGWRYFYNMPNTKMATPLSPDQLDISKVSAKHIIYVPCNCDQGRNKAVEKLDTEPK